jgi:hypothetical protein
MSYTGSIEGHEQGRVDTVGVTGVSEVHGERSGMNDDVD